MYAIVDIAGIQFKVKKGSRIKAPKLNLEVGESTQLTSVLFWSKEDEISIGQPVLSDIAVNAKVLAHGRDKRVVVFKMKKRKGYRKKNGHRQDFTELLIEDFVAPGQIPEVSAEVVPEEEAVTAASPEPEEEQTGAGVAAEEAEKTEETTAEESAIETTAQTDEAQEAEAASSKAKNTDETEPKAGKNNSGGK